MNLLVDYEGLHSLWPLPPRLYTHVHARPEGPGTAHEYITQLGGMSRRSFGLLARGHYSPHSRTSSTGAASFPAPRGTRRRTCPINAVLSSVATTCRDDRSVIHLMLNLQLETYRSFIDYLRNSKQALKVRSLFGRRGGNRFPTWGGKQRRPEGDKNGVSRLPQTSRPEGDSQYGSSKRVIIGR